MKYLTDLIAENSITIVAVILIFLSGIGIGAGITDMINEKENEDTK